MRRRAPQDDQHDQRPHVFRSLAGAREFSEAVGEHLEGTPVYSRRAARREWAEANGYTFSEMAEAVRPGPVVDRVAAPRGRA